MNRTIITLAALSALPLAALAQAQMTKFVTLQHDDMLSSNVVGVDVYDGSNNDIGKIQDIAFDSSKQVKGYILSVGGFLGKLYKGTTASFERRKINDARLRNLDIARSQGNDEQVKIQGAALERKIGEQTRDIGSLHVQVL